jgi:photosystem II stability/assembly factor-like uncharacterized protein
MWSAPNPQGEHGYFKRHYFSPKNPTFPPTNKTAFPMIKQTLLLAIFSLVLYSVNAQQKSKAQALTTPMQAPAAAPDLNTIFKPMKWRSIGPFRGGRSVAVSGVVGDPNTYYMGVTGGGVWKTDDMGNTWNNCSDGYFTTGSVGAIAVSESHPHVVFVGMGEHAVRGVMTHHGDGVYKSMDAGKTWQKMGLTGTQHISRIRIHPQNPDVVYVAAQGALYGPTTERGIYKSLDGGKTWNRVLYVDEKTGCSELSMDMNNPEVLYAAMWEYGRQPWRINSGGPGSGLYKTNDGGATWNKIHEGLPEEKGKMAIEVCRSNPDRVYALIESDSEKEKGGLFVSNNAGKSWTKVSNDQRLDQRAWYYIEVFADPQNDNTVYVLSAPALRSIDGGKTWETIEGAHGDYHDLWINPRNPKNMVMGDDGGASVSLNFGKTWSTQTNMPTAQFYRINVDNQFPYRIYAGQQDNSSVVIANRELNNSGITQESWSYSAGGESAFLAFNPDDPRYVIGGSYLGTIEVLDTRAKAGTNIMAAPIQYLARETKDMKYRYNWNAPIIWSKHEPNTFYHAAQVLLRTGDMGLTWEEVSPDLTRNEKEKQGKGGGPYTNEAVGAENYGTIAYVIESPHEPGVIYTGSDDGLVHLTRDGGKNWQNVTPVGLKECLINAIEVSPHDPAIVYIATTRYKFNDHTPGLYKSTDYGKTWTNISAGIPQGAFTRVVREDEVRRDLLFAGTETGLFLSWDGGKSWSPFQLNLPVTPITDLRVHQGNLIAATSGRSFWILDDLSLLRQWQVKESFVLYQPSPVILANGSSPLNKTDLEFKGSDPMYGVNPSNCSVIYYYLPAVKDSLHISLKVIDLSGKVIRTFSSKADTSFTAWDGGPSAEPVLPKSKGLNRFVWDLRHATMPGVPGTYLEASFKGHKASPGKYRLLLTYDGIDGSSDLEIQANPLYPADAKTYADYHDLMSDMEAKLTQMHQLINTLHTKRLQLEKLLGRLPAEDKYKPLQTDGKTLAARLKAWDEELIQRKSKAYDDVENFPNKFTAEYLFLINHAESDIPRPNQPSRDRKKELDAQWALMEAKGKALLEVDIPAFNQKAWVLGIGAVWE